MARKPKKPKPGQLPPRLTALPTKLPFSMSDRGAYINRPWVACERLGKEFLGSIFFRFSTGVVEAAAVSVDEIDIEWQGTKQFYVDGSHTGFGSQGLAQTHLQWLKNQALRGGATPEAIRFLKSVIKLTKKEEAEMAAKEKLAKKGGNAKTKPVGGGGKVTGGKGKGNPEALEKARAAAAARTAETHGKKVKLNITSKDLGTDKAKLRGGRLAKMQWMLQNKPKTVGDCVGNVCKDEEGNEHKIDMGALRGMEKRGHISIG